MRDGAREAESGAKRFDPSLRGFHVVYRHDVVNHCPSCGRTHWIIGRFSAECGFCATALPMVETGMMGSGTHSRNRHPTEIVTAA